MQQGLSSSSLCTLYSPCCVGLSCPASSSPSSLIRGLVQALSCSVSIMRALRWGFSTVAQSQLTLRVLRVRKSLMRLTLGFLGLASDQLHGTCARWLRRWSDFQVARCALCSALTPRSRFIKSTISTASTTITSITLSSRPFVSTDLVCNKCTRTKKINSARYRCVYQDQ